MDSKHLTPLNDAMGDSVPIKILMYHRIVSDESLCNAHWSYLHVSRLRRHLELLERLGYSAITFRDCILYSQGEITLPARPVIITFDDGYLDIYTTAFPLLQEFGMKAVVFVLGDRKIKENIWDSALGLPRASLLDNDHIRELHRAGYEIGSHSMSHVRLTHLHEDDVWNELSHSRLVLEALLDSRVCSLAYPYGVTSTTVKNTARNAGYLFACSVGSGPVAFGADPFEIRRITVYNTVNAAGLAMRLTKPYLMYSRLRSRVREALSNAGHTERNPHRIITAKPTPA
jgi:peptidoglycan/xylan/chitin deacetylase (PgdA/CDA1 family)